jgi:hypothetical protein
MQIDLDETWLSIYARCKAQIAEIPQLVGEPANDGHPMEDFLQAQIDGSLDLEQGQYSEIAAGIRIRLPFQAKVKAES